MLHINETHHGCNVDIYRSDKTKLFEGEIVGVQENSGVVWLTVRITLEQRQMSYHYRFNTGSANQWTRIHPHGDEEYTTEGYYIISLAIGRTDIF